MIKKLKFVLGNAKLSKTVATFSLPAGHTCPFAKECLSKANRITGRLTDGKHCRVRCFSVSQECAYPNVRKIRWDNYEMLEEAGTTEKMGKLIQRSLPAGIFSVRPGVAGDFYKESYFLAWLNVALNNPNIVFYGYTKATPFLVKYKNHIPDNFRFVASKGGTCDNLISKHHLKFAEIVFSVQEAKDKGLSIDHDDSLAYNGKKSFALLIHGTQPPGTEASKAWRALIKQGFGGYGDKPKTSPYRGSTFIVYLNVNNKGRIIPVKKISPIRQGGLTSVKKYV